MHNTQSESQGATFFCCHNRYQSAFRGLVSFFISNSRFSGWVLPKDQHFNWLKFTGADHNRRATRIQSSWKARQLTLYACPRFPHRRLLPVVENSIFDGTAVGVSPASFAIFSAFLKQRGLQFTPVEAQMVTQHLSLLTRA